MCLPLKAAIDFNLNTHTSMICVCVCMNSNDVWAVSVKISSYLWDGCRVKTATTQMLVNLVMSMEANAGHKYLKFNSQ